VPDEVGGEHADEHVGADSAFEAVVDGSEVEVDGFEGPELGFDEAEPFVGFDDFTRVEPVGVDAGADDVDAVEGGFSIDGFVFVPVGEDGFTNGQVVVFCHLVFVDDPADPYPDDRGVFEPACSDGGDDLVECGVGGLKEVSAFPGPFLGEGGVAADDEAFTRDSRVR
jgi:hypothetical protein